MIMVVDLVWPKTLLSYQVEIITPTDINPDIFKLLLANKLHMFWVN